MTADVIGVDSKSGIEAGGSRPDGRQKFHRQTIVAELGMTTGRSTNPMTRLSAACMEHSMPPRGMQAQEKRLPTIPFRFKIAKTTDGQRLQPGMGASHDPKELPNTVVSVDYCSLDATMHGIELAAGHEYQGKDNSNNVKVFMDAPVSAGANGSLCLLLEQPVATPEAYRATNRGAVGFGVELPREVRPPAPPRVENQRTLPPAMCSSAGCFHR